MVAFIAFGLTSYRDYGVSWDENAQMNIGKVNYKYITKRNSALLTFVNRYYGPFFEVPIYRLTAALPNPEQVYARHLGIFFVFAMGVITLYLLAYRLFHNSWWSLLTVILLVLSPRILADSFYNSKDIPFMAFFSLAILSIVIFLDAVWSDRRWYLQIGAAAFSALTCASAIDIRIPGVVLIPIASVFLVLIGFCHPKRWKNTILIFGVYLLLTLSLVILFWPALWHDPLIELINGFMHMSRYPWDYSMLYRGQYIQASNPVWHYLPTWISITTPLLQLAGFILGIICLCITALKGFGGIFSSPIRSLLEKLSPDHLVWAIIVGWLVFPLAAVMVFRSVVYDGWRQMYFIYPSILLIAVFGLKTVCERLSGHFNHSVWLKIFSGIVLTAGLMEPLIFILQYHPYENVYFNVFAGDPSTLRQNFEQDYWGLSYKQGIDFILTHDSSKKIHLAIDDYPGNEYIRYMLTPDQASRFVIGSLKNSDYFITTFRNHPDDYGIGNEFFSVNIRGAKILAVYKLR
jgi:hypothetical protein